MGLQAKPDFSDIMEAGKRRAIPIYMSNEKTSAPGINSWLEEELYQQYLHNHQSVGEQWKEVFDSEDGQNNGNGSGSSGQEAAPAPAPVTPTPRSEVPSPPAPSPVPAPAPKVPAAPAVNAGPADQLTPLRGAALRIAENMNLSLTVPTATSQRIIPVRIIDENRRILNEHREFIGKGKISYTHLIGWAIIQALKANPGINNAYAENDGQAFRIVRNEINFGIAVDIPAKDGTRSLVVPSIKNVGNMNFSQYLAGFDDLVVRSRKGKLTLADFQGTTISLTNPGTVGTVGSVPRLMPGMGAIIATGAMDYPAEYMGVSPEMKAALGISKVMMMTCTYDHRIIQGAESGVFLGRVQDLLQGKDGFYDDLFADLRMPYRPVVWQTDITAPALPGFAPQAPAKREVNKEAAILQLINAYRLHGHLIADINPLSEEAPALFPELDPATYGLSLYDFDREFNLGGLGHLTGNAAPKPVATLREILQVLRRAYCGKFGVEYMYIQDPEQKRWIQRQLEAKESYVPYSPEQKTKILEHILEAEMMEQFLDNRFKGAKRFSLEGGESTMVSLHEFIERAGSEEAHEVIIGMAHRGRLNVLVNIAGKPFSQLVSEFEGNFDSESTQGSGDVKYHLGSSGVKTTSSGNEVVVSLAPNPSHLEGVNPVVEGIVRAKQARLEDEERSRVLPVLIHGDAAMMGQGVVPETLNLSLLPGYTTGGTLHLVINNQVGFTTNPRESRSTLYCTEVAKTIQAPIFHVNGDDPEAVGRISRIAYQYRQEFKRDVVIDIICYRKYGHNEGDDPTFTQPLMYRRIKEHDSPVTQYKDRLLREKVLTPEQYEQIRKRISDRLEEGFEKAKDNAQAFEVVEDNSEPEVTKTADRTAIDRAEFNQLVESLNAAPEEFHVHEKLKNTFIRKRLEAVNDGPIDWALGEALAFGSLALEGTPVRLAGQDSTRGTFSQRHLAFVDTETGEEYVPLQHLSEDQANVEIIDSSLSEYAAMGFELGYSIGDPRALVLWEAQFGDFVNGAQIMIDQFISSGESKWGQASSLVLLLPHGYEGQGPEHSSARIERFLQLCAENNMIVANCTTPAQYFHLLRRQRTTRKPLIVFTPKSNLRSPKAISHADEIAGGSFREVLGDSASTGDKVKRIIFTSGKVYYDLVQAREEKQASNVAIIRIEQLYPFPANTITDILARYPASADIVWVQEEPRNMGPWFFVDDRMRRILDPMNRRIRYVGRPESASPASGNMKRHLEEQKELLNDAFSAEPAVRPKRTTKKLVKRKRSS